MALRKIDLMHEQFGKSENLCKECAHFLRERYRDKAYRKCEVYGVTSSEASDWKAAYQACGLFNQPYNGPGIIRQVRPERKKDDDDKPLEGQEVLWTN